MTQGRGAGGTYILLKLDQAFLARLRAYCHSQGRLVFEGNGWDGRDGGGIKDLDPFRNQVWLASESPKNNHTISKSSLVFGAYSKFPASAPPCWPPAGAFGPGFSIGIATLGQV
jgi:hypothetical protein